MNQLSRADIRGYSLNNFGFIERLYIWSIIFEPLLLFLIFENTQIGISGNVSRLLQLIVFFLIFLRILASKISSLSLINPMFPLYRWYSIYLIFLLFPSVIGFFLGFYVSQNQTVNYLRPFLEYFIYVYQFVYFAIFPLFLLNNKRAFDYFLKAFLWIIFLSFILGLIDYLLISLFSIEFLPRHLSDMRHVGARFHGLAGEPRDAAVFMCFSMAMIIIYNEWFQKKIGLVWIFVFFIALLLTQSFSGFFGIILGLGLIFIYQLPRVPLRLFISIFFLFSLFLAAISTSIISSDRILGYIEVLPIGFQAFEEGLELPSLINSQLTNIYPIWVRFVELSELDFFPSLFGSGVGTVSIKNSFIVQDLGGVFNPNANIVRILYDSGIIGLFLYLLGFIYPIMKASTVFRMQKTFIFLSLLLVGSSLGHRSTLILIYLGIVMLIFTLRKKQIDSKKEELIKN